MRLCTRIRPDTTWSTGIGDEEESRIRQAGVSSAVQKYITVYLGEFDDSNDERRIRSEAYFEKIGFVCCFAYFVAISRHFL